MFDDRLLCQILGNHLNDIKNLTYPSYPYLLTSACAAATAPAMPPRIPGIPCKLCTPHVSWVLVYFVKNGCRRDARRCEVKLTTPKSKSMLRFLFSILRHDMNYQYLLSGMRIPRCSVLRQSNQSKEPPTDWLTYSTLFPRQHHRREWHSEREPKDKKEIISEHLAFTIWCSSQFSHFLAQDVVLKLWRDFRLKKVIISHHAQSPFGSFSLEERRQRECGHTSSSQWEVRVDDGAVLCNVIRSH